MLGEGTFSVFIVDPGDQLDEVNRVCWALVDSDQANRDRPGHQATFLPQRVAYYLSQTEARKLVSDLARIGATAVMLEHGDANALSTKHDVILEAAGTDRMAVLKAVRTISGLDLASTKALLDQLPATVARDLDPRPAANAALDLMAAGARVSLTGDQDLRDALAAEPTAAGELPGSGEARHAFCTSCGTPAAPEARFCGACGTSLTQAVAAQAPEEPDLTAGWRLAQSGLWTQAREALMREADEGLGESAVLMVVDCQERGDLEQAQQWLDRAFELGLRKFDRSLIGREPDLKSIDRFWKHGPNNARGYIFEPHLVLADSARSVGLTSTAQHWYLHALAEGSTEAIASLIDLHRELGHDEEVSFWEYQAEATTGDLDVVLERIALAQESHDYAQANEWIRRSVLLGNPRATEQIRENEERRARHKAATAPAKENQLAQSIEAIFADPALETLMIRGFGVTDGVNKDEVIGSFLVTAKLADYPSAEEYLVVTRERIGLFRKSGFLREEVSMAFAKDEILDIGLGDSNHYEMSGFVGRGTDYLTLTLNVRDGSQFTRHMFLGHSESQINQRLRWIQEFLTSLIANDWPISEGPGYRSEGGYRRTFSYGFGVWF